MTDQPVPHYSYKDLQVWQKGIDFCGQVMKSLQELKPAEKQLIGESLLSTAIAIPSHIANGYASKSKPMYIEGLKSALGQAAVVETIMESCKLAGISLKLEADDLKYLRIMLAKLTAAITGKNKDAQKEPEAAIVTAKV